MALDQVSITWAPGSRTQFVRTSDGAPQVAMFSNNQSHRINADLFDVLGLPLLDTTLPDQQTHLPTMETLDHAYQTLVDLFHEKARHLFPAEESGSVEVEDFWRHWRLVDHAYFVAAAILRGERPVEDTRLAFFPEGWFDDGDWGDDREETFARSRVPFGDIGSDPFEPVKMVLPTEDGSDDDESPTGPTCPSPLGDDEFMPAAWRESALVEVPGPVTAPEAEAPSSDLTDSSPNFPDTDTYDLSRCRGPPARLWTPSPLAGEFMPVDTPRSTPADVSKAYMAAEAVYVKEEDLISFYADSPSPDTHGLPQQNGVLPPFYAFKPAAGAEAETVLCGHTGSAGVDSRFSQNYRHTRNPRRTRKDEERPPFY